MLNKNTTIIMEKLRDILKTLNSDQNFEANKHSSKFLNDLSNILLDEDIIQQECAILKGKYQIHTLLYVTATCMFVNGRKIMKYIRSPSIR